ncbi:hypothetical protein IMZ48_38050, partial [Candidatus Bathyarchaeota archaeon]|nr:hypothetical protein [Candidatus Bathyarchaeota archaeon]
MVQTRGQEHQEGGTKRKSGELTGGREAEHKDVKQAHRGTEETGSATKERGFKLTVDRLLSECGGDPLNGLNDDKIPPSQVVMAHILNALLSSARISHETARSTLESVLNAGYNDLRVLHGTSWYERTEVLTEGGYARYRERMADFLGDLLKLMEAKYGKFCPPFRCTRRKARMAYFVNTDDDAAKILPEDKKGDEAREELAARLREIKGLGPVGVDIAMGGLQSYFTNISPFLDHRSLKMAERIGLGGDVERMYEAVGKD